MFSQRENNVDARKERGLSKVRQADLEMQRSPDRQSKSLSYKINADQLNSVRYIRELLTKPAPKPPKQQPHPFSQFKQFLE